MRTCYTAQKRSGQRSAITGRHVNHQFFWDILGPRADGAPKAAIADAIKRGPRRRPDLDVLRRSLRDLERDIDRLLEQHEIGRLLTTIEGIGPQTSARLVATFGDFSSFRSAAALASYVGVVPALKQSGKRTFQRASLTPLGAARLRAKLWMPVLTAVRTNPWRRAYYERLIDRASCRKSPWSLRCGSCCTSSTAWPLIVVPSWPISSPRRPAREELA